MSLGLTGEIEKGWWSLVAAGRLMAGLWGDRRRSLSVYLVGLRYASVEDLQTVLALTASGEVSPVIGATLPLQEVRESHDLLERRAVVGKIVLTPGEWAS